MRTPLLILLLAVWGCQSVTDSPFTGHNTDNFAAIADTAAMPRFLQCRASVQYFYRLRAYKPFWMSPAGLTASGDSLLKAIATVDRLGLNPDDYHLRALQSLIADTTNVTRFSQMDVLLSDAWITLHSHLGKGRLDPKTLKSRNQSIVHKEAIAILQTVDDRSVIRRLLEQEPSLQQYRELKDQLQSFLLLGRQDPVQQGRAKQIAINMERWRWNNDKLPSRYISVNIPAFALRVFENDSLWLETRVIVGKRDTPTPIMESVIRSFIIYPYWHVPKSISTGEILPDLQVDRHYLTRNNFDVLDRDGQVILPDTIQWDFYSKDYFPFILRQREGSENSMGIIKFIFANNYGVYLHDTNSKRLFGRARRDLSHGCVRVSNAVALAHYLVRDDDIYVSPEDLDQYLSLQQRLKIDLRKSIPLRLEYFTAEVRNGVALFHEDIYKKDSLMMQNLYPPIQEQLAKPLSSL